MIETTLESRVQHALASNPHLPKRKFHFQAADGKIVLQGVVSSYYQKQMAQETLRTVEGVHEIENLLQVHWS